MGDLNVCKVFCGLWDEDGGSCVVLRKEHTEQHRTARSLSDSDGWTSRISLGSAYGEKYLTTRARKQRSFEVQKNRMSLLTRPILLESKNKVATLSAPFRPTRPNICPQSSISVGGLTTHTACKSCKSEPIPRALEENRTRVLESLSRKSARIVCRSSVVKSAEYQLTSGTPVRPSC